MAPENSWYYIAQIILVPAMTAYFLLAQLVPFETRNRDVKPFAHILAIVPLTAAAELVELFIQAQDGLPSILPTAALALFVLGVLIPLDSLWSTVDKAPAWNAHVGCWAAMAVFDSLTLLRLAIGFCWTPADINDNTAFSRTVAGLRCCTYFVLFHQYFLGSNYIPLGSKGSPTVAAAGDDKGKHEIIVRLDKPAEDEINELGLWDWVRRFSIFWVWIWPRGCLGLQMRIVGTAILVLTEAGLNLIDPWLQGVLVQSIVDGLGQRSMDPVWRPLAAVVLNSFTISSLGIGCVRNLVWIDVEIWRSNKMKTDIYAHIMRLDASFHALVNTTEPRLIADMDGGIIGLIDFMLFEALPKMASLWGAATTVLVSYGPFVALIQVYVVVLQALILKHQVRMIMPRFDERIALERLVERARQNGLRGWKTVAYHNQIGTAIKTYADRLETFNEKSRRIAIFNFGFTWSFQLVFDGGFLLSMALIIFELLERMVRLGL